LAVSPSVKWSFERSDRVGRFVCKKEISLITV